MTESLGLQAFAVDQDQGFGTRPVRARDPQVQAASMAKLAQVCMANSDSILQDLVDCLLELCEADSAGVSMRHVDEAGLEYWEWMATAGEVTWLAGTRFTEPPSPSAIAYRHNRPYVFRVESKFFELVGVKSPPITDGLVVPWHFGDVQRTIWIVAHEGAERFDRADLALIVNFGVIATQAFEYQKLQKQQQRTWAATTAAALVDALAYRINEPLRSMDTLIMDAARGESHKNAKALAQELSDPLQDLNKLVAEAFLPGSARKPN